jgi:hypothetical protein
MGRTHHNAFHYGLAADKRLFTALQHWKHLNVRGQAQKTSNGQGNS